MSTLTDFIPIATSKETNRLMKIIRKNEMRKGRWTDAQEKAYQKRLKKQTLKH
mgnify:CR=1 FL=1|tara:strand:- start:32 stop:190 length:159 start_codon:yes stop_codon:yes gene_type:complete